MKICKFFDLKLEEKNRNRIFFSFLLISIIILFVSSYISIQIVRYALIVGSLILMALGAYIYHRLHRFLYLTGMPILPLINPDIDGAKAQYNQFFKNAKTHIQMVSGLSPKFYDDKMKKVMKEALDRGVTMDILLDNPENKEVLYDLSDHPRLTIYLLPREIDYDFVLIDGKKLRVEEHHVDIEKELKADNSENRELVDKFEELFASLWSKIQQKQMVGHAH